MHYYNPFILNDYTWTQTAKIAKYIKNKIYDNRDIIIDKNMWNVYPDWATIYDTENDKILEK
jgi:hypothetical protein